MILTDQAHKDLVGQIQTKTARIKTIVAMGNDMKQEHLEEANKLKGEVAGHRDQIVKHNQAVELRGYGEDTERFLSDPVHKLPLPDGGDPMTTPAGSTHIERKGDKLHIFDDGPGVFGDAQWKAINEPTYQRAYMKYLRTGLGKLTLAERKNIEEGLDPQGGYLAPIDMLAKIVQRKPTPTRVAALVSQYQTSREFVEMMKVNYSTDNIYTTGFRVTKTGENPSSTTQARINDTSLFGVIRIPVHTFMMTGILTNNQVEDSALNILQWCSDKYRETTDILWDDKILNGTGKGEAEGVLMNPQNDANGLAAYPSYIAGTAGAAPWFTADDLLNLNLAIPEQYDSNVRYVMNKTSTWKAVRKFKDSSSRYLLGMGTQENGLQFHPEREYDGYPVVWSGLMPDTAQNAYPIVAGDWGGYQLVNRVGFSIQVLRELYAELNQVALVGRIRFGGLVVEPWRFRVLKGG